MMIPEDLNKNSHFLRYYRTWQKNPLSIVFVSLSQICLESGFLDQALEICEQGLTHHPDSVSGRLMLARIFYEKEDREKAREIAEKVLRDFPGQKEAWDLLQKILRLKAQNSENAAPSQAELPTHNLWENVTMAKIYADQGEKKIALGILSKLLSKNPNHSKVAAEALKLKEILSR